MQVDQRSDAMEQAHQRAADGLGARLTTLEERVRAIEASDRQPGPRDQSGRICASGQAHHSHRWLANRHIRGGHTPRGQGLPADQQRGLREEVGTIAATLPPLGEVCFEGRSMAGIG